MTLGEKLNIMNMKKIAYKIDYEALLYEALLYEALLCEALLYEAILHEAKKIA
jgi:hypothetical protein